MMSSAAGGASVGTATISAIAIEQEQQRDSGGQKSSISSSSSLLTESSSSLTSIPTNSPTSANSQFLHSMAALSMADCIGAANAIGITGPNCANQSEAEAASPSRQQLEASEEEEEEEAPVQQSILACESASLAQQQDHQLCHIGSITAEQELASPSFGSRQLETTAHPLAEGIRLARSSSLSLEFGAASEANEAGASATTIVASSCGNSSATSQSQENLASRADASAEEAAAAAVDLATTATTTTIQSGGLLRLEAETCQLAAAQFQVEQEPPVAPVETSATARPRMTTEAAAAAAATAATRNSSQSNSFSSSRFFSSKLNTGSLWSLLSVGSNNSANTNELESLEPIQIADNNDKQQQQDTKTGFFSRVQFKCQLQTSSSSLNQQQAEKTRQPQGNDNSQLQQQQHRQIVSAQHLSASNSSRLAQDCAAPATTMTETRKRFRFNVKYVGSAMLHKNFTLPMLEWIAKDIKRQTVKGAQSTSSRQFSIPARDIVLEIQSYQLTAISCKDGHCIFVHPMHCVSKYAQLQHDPTSFSYLIRDTKESPYFCHVFQAKSISKVHDIFSAIREATTGALIGVQPQEVGDSSRQLLKQQVKQVSVQRSASTDGQRLRGAKQFGTLEAPQEGHSQASIVHGEPTAAAAGAAKAAANSAPPQAAAAQAADHNQFENSYQFEVMFVKKVKLQCRRVPATFVDDALETLKSFEVLKGGAESKAAQIKGVGKRIINASVDERQEYDEACQSPTPSGGASGANQPAEGQTRRSSATQQRQPITGASNQPEERQESRSCQQSPAKSSLHQADGSDSISQKGADKQATSFEDESSSSSLQGSSKPDMKKKHQSMDCLKSIDFNFIKSAKDGNAPTYANDFSPYNTITSMNLNERIAAIPVVSSSVSLDHETRQRLARQVRETIMATAANIKKDVYASGDKLDSSSSSKALDSLSCTAMSSVPSNNESQLAQSAGDKLTIKIPTTTICQNATNRPISSAAAASQNSQQQQQQQQQSTNNNFDLFRRASARQVVKNRTMLLLIGKDELCTISIDKHQMLFSKSFSSIVHCLQGSNNKDHFGLICRDSGKINPNAESYAGFVFKCQSDKVVREIMSALKQVIYSSQHNYHGYNSPYNPLNAANQQQYKQQSPKFERLATRGTNSLTQASQDNRISQNQHHKAQHNQQQQKQQPSLATKRGFQNQIELDDVARQSSSSTANDAAMTAPPASSLFQSATSGGNSFMTASVLNSATNQQLAAGKASTCVPKNLIKSMFCDNCPLYWYHRLCCDIESLPADASKAIILRRIDTSLTEHEQDELYSRFSEFNIESIDEHNEIFMSLLRHQCERKQLKHNHNHSHLSALASNSAAQVKQPLSSPFMGSSSRQSSSLSQIVGSPLSPPASSANSSASSSQTRNAASGGHHRSGSSSGSLSSFVMGQQTTNATNQAIADASSVAIDNLKKAKNSISVSIENMLKRRSSIRDELAAQEEPFRLVQGSLPFRSGSFKTSSREARLGELQHQRQLAQPQDDNQSELNGNLKRSQSTSDYSASSNSIRPQQQQISSWKDSLSRTINDDFANPLVGLFLRRSSKSNDMNNQPEQPSNGSAENLVNGFQVDSPGRQPASPSVSESRFGFGSYTSQQQQSAATSSTVGGGSSPSSMLSSAFWKKSIFDKIRQPISSEDRAISPAAEVGLDAQAAAAEGEKVGRNEGQARPQPHEADEMVVKKRSREELRSLWRKAILEQITLLKMDKQNQRLQATAVECDIQRLKLNYRDVVYSREVLPQWDKLLKQDPTMKVEFVEVARLIRLGVPKQRRGEIWMFLMNQYQLRHGTSFQPADCEYKGDANQTYRSLLSQLSTQQHEIFVDIGRTFPTHPYYSQYLSIGQLSLFNLLKAYSLLDQDVGYCQGLSFVAGILMLHVNSEDEAFELMRHLLFNFGLRKQYLPSMNALHLQLYQITRLLRDHEYDLFNHFDHHDISPSLYAAPWFLTVFASQFPLGFVSRLLDLIFLIGIEAIFRVSLNLLAFHRNALLSCKSLEATMEFFRNDLIKIEDISLVKIFDQSMSLDLRNKLIEYEIEYTFYCAEDRARSTGSSLVQNPPNNKFNPISQKDSQDGNHDEKSSRADFSVESTSIVADATATVIIQHLLANNHLKSLRSNYSY